MIKKRGHIENDTYNWCVAWIFADYEILVGNIFEHAQNHVSI